MTNTLDFPTDVDWNFPDSAKEEGIHSIHPYPARFIPEIPRELIRWLGIRNGTVLFDPFCGSGVALVEAQRVGRGAIGVDLNPIACRISRAKTRPQPKNLKETAIGVLRTARAAQTTDIPLIPNLDHWFPKDIQNAVSRLVDAINNVVDPRSKETLELALSSILVRVSRQDSDTRYAAIEKTITADDVFKLFRVAVSRFVVSLPQTDAILPRAEVIERNVLQLQSDLISRPIGLVVTSPPYPNAYEYWLYHKYRMYWLGHDPQSVKKHEIGARAHFFKKNPPQPEDFLHQMKSIFDLINIGLVRGGHVCIVIGRSRVHGNVIDNASLVTEAALQSGLREVASIERDIAPHRKAFNLAHARIMTEHILVFRS